MKYEDTICAIATPPGQGGVAIIRVSGKEALAIVSKIYIPKAKNTTIENQVANTSSYGTIYKEKEILDKVITFVFRSPYSFTGEDTVEITCHGSIYIQQEITKLLLNNGCRLAYPGEFTQRAFLNGKIDLSQAEAVADLISSSSAATHRLAFNQMRGGFSKELKNLRFQLLRFASLIELELDFGEENVEFVDRIKLLNLALSIKNTLCHLVQSFGLGNAIKNGIPVVIVGGTNTGKSTLLNLLLKEEKAIVSTIHGTTRDIIEDVVNINGITFRFIDTAGIRNAKDEIETLGIERTYQKINKAFIVIWMIDITKLNKETKCVADRIIPLIKDKKLIIIFNKIDKLDTNKQSVSKEKFLLHIPVERIYLSAKYKKNIDILEKALLKAANLSDLNYDNVIVTNIRHHEALKLALKAIQRVEEGLKTNISCEFISQDIRECTHFLGEITGEITTDEILENIFKNFCIGK